jgi:hypothetical protein
MLHKGKNGIKWGPILISSALGICEGKGPEEIEGKPCLHIRTNKDVWHGFAYLIHMEPGNGDPICPECARVAREMGLLE